MKPTFWQKIKSNFIDIHIESTSSEYNEILTVLLCKGRFQLVTENAIYSYGDLYSNYKRAFDKMNLPQLDIENVLILGFGMASIPYMLEKNLKRNYHYTAVEIDETVAYFADKYVTQYLESPIEMILGDAYFFSMQSESTYDMICVDVFIDDEIPPQFETPEFWESIKRMLGDKGVLLFNRLYLTDEDKRITNYFYENVFLPIFKNGAYLDVGGNWIISNRSLLAK